VLVIDAAVADEWGGMSALPIPVVDGLLGPVEVCPWS
jgi:hypothetical protein